MIDEGVCRTSPATPVVLQIYIDTTKYINKIVQRLACESVPVLFTNDAIFFFFFGGGGSVPPNHVCICLCVYKNETVTSNNL